MEPILEIRNVSKSYGATRVVEDVSLAIERGELFSLVGPSGCGKTTSLRMVAGFERPDSGAIRLNGTPIDALPPYQRKVSTVFQSYALFPHLTVRGNIEFGLRRRGDRDPGRSASQMIELLHLEGKEARFPAELSGGERQRVALARSLVLAPDVLLLDEPLSALDPLLRKQVRAELQSLQRRVGITFLMVTHDQEEAMSMSDRIAVMNRGRIEQTGTPQQVYLEPRTRFVAGFLGPVNWIDGVGVRPEVTHVSRRPPSGAERSREVRIQALRFLGNCVQIEGRLTPSGDKVIADTPRSVANDFQAGEAVQVWWHPADEIHLPQ